MGLFLAHRVSIQEGPTLAASKLTVALGRNFDGVYELTLEDLRSYVNARSIAEAQRAERRKPSRHRPSSAEGRSPWRDPNL